MAPVFLAVDAGTTRIKTIAVTEDGAELDRATRPAPVTTPRQERVEQDMDATWTRTADTLKTVTNGLDESHDICGVAVTGQGAGCWLVDDEGEPVRNAILWSDGRAATYVRRWRESDIYDRTFEDLGHGLFPGLPLPITRWLRDNEPRSLARADTLFFCKDWIRYRLTGNLSTDTSDASLAHYQPDAGRYAPEAAERLGVQDAAGLIPEPVSPTTVAGTVTTEAAAQTGLRAGTPVVTGAMDVAASAFGSGVVAPGSASTVVGTTLQNQIITETPNFDSPRAGYTLALGVEGMGLRAMGAMTGTPNLDWALSTLTDIDDFDTVERVVESVPPASDGLLYHPYLSAAGEKAPFVHPGARGQFTGLTPEHTEAHLVRAVYEGIALAVRDCYENLPRSPSTVHISGGGARSPFWCQLFADCLDCRLVVPTGSELGARGAALLSGVGLGRYESLRAAVDRTTSVERTYDPDPERAARYDRWYDVYRETYEAMSDVWDHRDRLRHTQRS